MGGLPIVALPISCASVTACSFCLYVGVHSFRLWDMTRVIALLGLWISEAHAQPYGRDQLSTPIRTLVTEPTRVLQLTATAFFVHPPKTGGTSFTMLVERRTCTTHTVQRAFAQYVVSRPAVPSYAPRCYWWRRHMHGNR